MQSKQQQTKKNKICVIGEKIFILLTKSDNGTVEEFINKVHSSLKVETSVNVSYLVLKINQFMNSVDDIFNEFDLEAARTQLNQR